MSNDDQHDLTGKSRLVANVVTSWVSHFLIIITGFFMPRIIDAQLGQTLLGVWDFAWSLVAYVSLAQLGIGSSLNRFVANYRAEGADDKLQTAASTVALIQCVLSLLVAIAIVTTAYTLPMFHGEQLGKDLHTAQLVVLFLGLSIAVQFFFDTSRGILTGSHRWDLYNALYSGTQLLCSLFMLIALLLGYSLVALSIIYFSMLTIEGIIRFFLARHICPAASFSRSAISKEFGLEILKFGLKSFIMQISPIIVIQGCSILIASTLGHAALAVIARPNALIRHIQTFITQFTFILTPMAGPLLSQEGPESLRQFTIACARYGLAFTLPLIILFCYYGDELILVWMGPKYVNETLVMILGLGMLLPMSQSPIVRVLIGLDYHGKAALMSVVVSLILFGSGAAIIRATGESLEAFALLIAVTMTTVNGILVPIYSCKKLEINLLGYIKEVFFKVTTLCAIALVPLYVLDQVIELRGMWILFNTAVFGICVIILYWVFLLPADGKQKLLAKIPKFA